MKRGVYEGPPEEFTTGRVGWWASGEEGYGNLVISDGILGKRGGESYIVAPSGRPPGQFNQSINQSYHARTTHWSSSEMSTVQYKPGGLFSWFYRMVD